MREQMQTRLAALKRELKTGQAQLREVESRRQYLHETILRISPWKQSSTGRSARP
jgi:hypothetical protein